MMYFMPVHGRNYCYRWVGFYGSATKDIIFQLEWPTVLHPALCSQNKIWKCVV